VALRVLHLSTYDHGGAGRAATALHDAMSQHGMTTELRNASGSRFRVARQLERRIPELQHSPWRTWRSIGRFASLKASEINASEVDVVNLHWITDGFLSVEEVGRITKPMVWTMHDMWPLAGTEHYASEHPQPTRWQSGYTKDNRPEAESGPDLDRWTWERKRDHWSKPICLVPVSTWLAGASGSAQLTKSWPISVVPNVMDVDTFSPGSKHAARIAEGLPDAPLIAFASAAGISDERKGWSLLAEAIPLVRREIPDVRVLVIGRGNAKAEAQVPVDTILMGHVSSNERMANLMRAADVVAVPSTADNLPMAACEAQCTGRAVVGFRLGGLPDTVQHLATGYLADPLDVEDLARGLIMAIEDAQASDEWGQNARERASSLWSPRRVVDSYAELYERLLA